MAAARDIAALGDAVARAAAQILELGRDWYKASPEWIAFQASVDRFSTKRDFSERDVTKLGASWTASLTKVLEEAKASVEVEAGKLAKKSDKARRIWSLRCWPTLGTAVFPAEVDQSIATVIEALDEIQRQLFMKEEEAVAALERSQLSRQYSLPFGKDVYYVPLAVAESAIRDALTSGDAEQDGPVVVLLHGAAGTGKSTLARAVALEYEAAGEVSGFEHVVYVECGPESDTDTVQLKLLRRLGSSPGLGEEQFLPLQRGFWSNWSIPKMLRFLLGERKLLIVLDDVWWPKMLQQTIELCGRRVKCLVTSHVGDVCDELNCLCIDVPMKGIGEEDARKILASHVGFADHYISPQLEDLVDEMVRASGLNPLTLTAIATAIDTKRSSQREVWEAACKHVFSSLHSEDTAYVLGRGYPKGFRSAMQIIFESLHPEAQNVLVLLHSCRGPSVPEEVIRMFYHICYRVGKGPAQWEKLTMQLENRELVKICVSRKRRSWSAHSLQKKFAVEEKSDLRESAFALLADSASDPSSRAEIVKHSASGMQGAVLDTLCALYFDQQFARRMATRMGIPLDRFSLKRRIAVEPVTLLLGRPLGVHWTQRQRGSAGEVLRKYICTGMLEDRDVEDLLASPVSVLAMLSALGDIGALEGKIGWANDVTQNLVNALFTIFKDLDDGGRKLFYCDPDLLDEAVYSLCNVIAHLDGETKLIIVNSDEFLGKLVRALSREHNIELQWLALKFLFTLLEVDDSRLRLLQFPGAVEEIAKFLPDRSPVFQNLAVEVIANLTQGMGAITEDLKRVASARLNEVKSLADNLASLMADRASSAIQFPAALALTFLSPPRANEAQLYSGTASCGRGHANMLLGLYEESLADLNSAQEYDDLDKAQDPDHDVFFRHICLVLLSDRSFVKAKLGDFEGSLADADKVIAMECRPRHLRERGILKRMMEDLDGALADLNKGLDMEANDYEMLKHRGYVKYLTGDEKGAHADAMAAQKVGPSSVDAQAYGSYGLGASCVEFLGYNLK